MPSRSIRRMRWLIGSWEPARVHYESICHGGLEDGGEVHLRIGPHVAGLLEGDGDLGAAFGAHDGGELEDHIQDVVALAGAALLAGLATVADYPAGDLSAAALEHEIVHECEGAGAVAIIAVRTGETSQVVELN